MFVNVSIDIFDALPPPAGYSTNFTFYGYVFCVQQTIIDGNISVEWIKPVVDSLTLHKEDCDIEPSLC